MIIYLFICLFIYLFTYLFIYLFIYFIIICLFTFDKKIVLNSFRQKKLIEVKQKRQSDISV